jgi:bacterioferritin-associated ferredoxin
MVPRIDQGRRAVIVCSCNRLSDRQIRATADATPCLRTTQVHACLGCRPRCGQCFATIKTILEQSAQAQASEPATAISEAA